MDVAWAFRPKPGERVCGDLPVAVREDDRTLVALIDGLGHGPQAAAAAECAAACVRAQAALALPELLAECHRALAGTRGVALTVVRVEHGTLSLVHAGIGNVQLYASARDTIRPIPRPGVLGGGLRRTVLESRFQLHAGDLLALATDGVSSRLELDRYRGLDAQRIAEAILRDFGKDHDDASCAVLRC